MNKKKGVWLATAASVAAASIYHYAKGTGIFNRYRFKNEHDAISRYVDSHYKNAHYSAIQAIPGGWITVITTDEKTKITLSVTKTSEKLYVFKELPVEVV